MSWRCTACEQVNNNEGATSCFYCGEERPSASGEEQCVPQDAPRWFMECDCCHTIYPCEGSYAHMDVCPKCEELGNIYEAHQIAFETPHQVFPEPEPEPMAHYRLRFVALGLPEGQGCSFTVSESGAKLGRVDTDVAKVFFQAQLTVSSHHLMVGHNADGWYIENQQAHTEMNKDKLEPMEQRYLSDFPILLQLGCIRFCVSEERVMISGGG